MNGYRGVSFSSADLTRAACDAACNAILAEGGCAAIVPTVVTASAETYEAVLPILADAIEDARFDGRLLGIHLEGPFISDQRGAVGAHPARHVVRATEGCRLLDTWQTLARGHIRLITIAAESEGAAELCAHAVRLGIAVSLGHQLAGAAEIGALADAGATLLTHLGNGCPNVIHRHDNHLWPALADDRLAAMLIPDGQHVPAPMLAVALRAKGIGRAIVVSDVAPVAGLPDGKHPCFGGTVHVEGAYVRSADRSSLAGSGSLMIACMNHLASLGIHPRADDDAPLTLDELVAVGFYNPLRAIGLCPQETRRRLMPHGARVEWSHVTRQFSLVR